jgi:hypothetical protein
MCQIPCEPFSLYGTGGGPKAKKEMVSSWLERQARMQDKERKKAHTTRAAKQDNARPPSVRVAKGAPKARKELQGFLLERQARKKAAPAVPTKQLGMMIAFKGSPSAGGLLMPDDASDVSDNEALGAASSSRPPLSRASRRRSSHTRCVPAPLLLDCKLAGCLNFKR